MRKWKVSFLFLALLGFVFLFGGKPQTAEALSTGTYVKEAENSQFILYANQQTAAIKIENKSSGYTWDSSMDNLQNQGLNGSWQQFVESAISIDYLNAQNKQRSMNLASGAQVAMQSIKNGFQANISFGLAGIKMILTVQLTEQGVEVKIPFSDIQESTMGRLVDLNVYPFLGATAGSSVPGYMVIPDGSGAEISYQDSTLMPDAYQQPYYGADLGIPQNQAASNQNTSNNTQNTTVQTNTINPLTLPVYGIVNGTNALLSYVKSGAEYGQLTASKAGYQTNFNWITSKFTYRASYNQPTSQADSSGVQMYQQNSNPVNIDIKYDLLSGADANYTGLAKAAQKELVSQGILHKQTSQTPVMALNFLGAAQTPGLLWSSLSVFTTANNIASQMKSSGSSNVLYSLTGFTAGGYDKSVPNAFPVDGAVGSTGDFQQLSKTGQQSKNPFALTVDYGDAPTQPSGIKDNQYLQQINGFFANYVAPAAYPQLVNRDLSSIKDLGVKNLSLTTIGNVLYSDYNDSSKPVTRTQTMQYQTAALAALKKAGLSLTANNPNLYAWKYLTAISNLPTSDSYFVYETASIPFLQTILHGYIDYYSPSANSASSQAAYKLTNLAIGAGGSYTLTQSSSSALTNTVLWDNYNTQLKDWQKQLKSDYKDYEKVSQATKGAAITSQTQLTASVSETSYSNGVKIVVNMGNSTYKNGSINIQVGKQSYVIVKGGKS